VATLWSRISIDLNAIAIIGAAQICCSASRPPGRDLATVYVERRLQLLLSQPGFAKASLGVYLLALEYAVPIFRVCTLISFSLPKVWNGVGLCGSDSPTSCCASLESDPDGCHDRLLLE